MVGAPAFMRGKERFSAPGNSLDSIMRFSAGDARAVLSGLKSLRENSPCVVPSGLDWREILPGTPVPGYRLSRPFGTDCVG
jgi:hypothetical protein